MKIRTLIERTYFNWLIGLVDGEKNIPLMRHLHETEYYSILPNDDNRAVDGEKLRDLFELEEGIRVDELMGQRCTLLEMVVALCKRLVEDILGEETPAYWFWVILNNMRYLEVKSYVYSDISKSFLERKYRADGLGGLFPLKWPNKDQTKVEIWYQMMSYLNENQ